MRTAILAALTLAFVSVTSNAEARQRTYPVHPDCNITMPCEGVGLTPFGKRAMKVRGMGFGFGEPVLRYAPAPSRVERSVSTSGLVAPLVMKLASIQAACPGTKLISGVRHTRIRKTGRMSLHAQGKAIDVRGPYGCIYAQLQGWAGGYSTDARRMAHIHISYDATGGREMGLRFRH